MSPLVLAILLVLAGILIWRQYSAHLRLKKLPPGPTPLPIIGNLHLIGKLPHRDFHQLSQKYGPIMSLRLGSLQAVVVSSPETAKLFLATHDIAFASRPQIQASEYLTYGSKGMAFSEYGTYWRSLRKFCTVELLSAVKVNSFAGMRREEIGLMVEEIMESAAAREVANLSEKAGELVESITFRMLFGRKKDDRFDFRRLVNDGLEATGAFNISDYIPMLAPFDLQGLTRRFKVMSKATDKMLETMIDEHEEDIRQGRQKAQNDIIDIMLLLKNQPSNTHDELSQTIDRSSMKAILLDVLAGAIDTSKTAIEWIMSTLIKHPRVMKELQQELKMVVGENQMVNEADLTKLNYLHMIIKETLRLYTVAPLLVPHVSREDVVVDGYHIPKNSRLFVNYWAFGHDPKIWSENCEEFLPERFIDSKIDLRGHDFQLIPFGSGRRGCPGMHLGLLTMSLATAQLVHCFDWELPNGMLPCDLDMNERFGLTTPRATPLLAIPIYRL